MIKYRPRRRSVSLSLKEEILFDSMEDLIKHIHERWSHVVSFVGSHDPFRMDEILISDVQGDDPLTGYKNGRLIFVTRMSDSVCHKPFCVGYCGE